MLLVLVVAACEAPAGPRAPAPVVRPVQEIAAIALDGGPTLPVAALRARLGSRVGQPVSDAQLERDRIALEAELFARGYLGASVAPASVTFDRRGGGAAVVFDVRTGPIYHLRAIDVRGPGQRDAGVVTLLAGDPAVDGRIERARQTLLETFARRGARLEVAVELTTDRAAAAVDVALVTR